GYAAHLAGDHLTGQVTAVEVDLQGHLTSAEAEDPRGVHAADQQAGAPGVMVELEQLLVDRAPREGGPGRGSRPLGHRTAVGHRVPQVTEQGLVVVVGHGSHLPCASVVVIKARIAALLRSWASARTRVGPMLPTGIPSRALISR